jgi:hypothetical protein
MGVSSQVTTRNTLTLKGFAILFDGHLRRQTVRRAELVGQASAHLFPIALLRRARRFESHPTGEGARGTGHVAYSYPKKGTKSMNRRRASLLVALVVLASLLAGCFDIEQSLTLNKDLSGKAGFRMAIDFEPMVMIMLQMQRSMDGKKGTPTAEEIAKAKKEFLDQQKSKGKDETVDRKALETNLPEGITLVAETVKEDGLKVVTNLVFGFSDPSKLSLINLPKKEGEKPDDKSVINKPFDGLEIKDEGKTILITSKPADPMSGVGKGVQQAGGGADNKEMDAMMKDAMKGLRVAVRIEAPFKVVESNATRKEGNALLWEYTLDSFEKMQKEGAKDLRVFVRYRK